MSIEKILDDIFKEKDREVLYKLIEIASQSKSNVKKFKIYKRLVYPILSPRLKELLDNIITLEEKLEKMKLMVTHDLFPTLEDIFEVITIADRVRSLTLAFVRVHLKDRETVMKIEADFREYLKVLQKAKEGARPFARYEEKPKELFSLILEFSQFVRQYIEPLFDEVAKIVVFQPEKIWDSVEKIVAKEFAKRFLPSPPVEEEG